MDNQLQIYLDSNLASKYVDSTIHCEYILPLIDIDSQYHFILSLVNASIPHSFYNVNSNNNRFQYIEDPYVTFVEHNYVIPIGNYTITQFVSQLQSMISPLQISYNSITNKMTFTHPTLPFCFYKSNNTCFELLGLSNYDHFSPVNPKVIVSDVCCSMFSVRSICVCSNFHTDNVHVNKPHMQTIIGSIPVNAGPNSIITYQNLNSFKNNLFTNVVNAIAIKFVDQDGNKIDLNGCHYSMTLQLDIIKYVD